MVLDISKFYPNEKLKLVYHEKLGTCDSQSVGWLLGWSCAVYITQNVKSFMCMIKKRYALIPLVE